jgi:hypothetical protein
MCFLALSLSLSVPLSPRSSDNVLSAPSLFPSVFSNPRLLDSALYCPLYIYIYIFVFMPSSKIVWFLALSLFSLSTLSSSYFKHFLALTSNTFRRIHHFLIWWIRYLSFVFLLYKVYYLKSLMRLSIISIVKRGGNCHNLFLGYSPKFYPLFFFK